MCFFTKKWKQRLLFWSLFVAMSCAAQLANATEVLMPQFGVQEVTVSADAPVTFYDFKGEESIPSSTGSNSYATTIFRPAEAGNSILVEFETLEVIPDFGTYYCYLNVYDGVFDYSDITYPTTTGEVNNISVFSQTVENFLVQYSNKTPYTGVSVVSSDATGALSFCFHYRYASKCEGWKATVKSVKLEDMETQSAVADYSQAPTSIYAGEKNISLASVKVVTEGIANPDKLTQIKLTVSGAQYLENVKLYKGNAERTSELQEVAATLNQEENDITFTLEKALSSGENVFCVGADVLTTAPFDASISATITEIATSAGFTTLTAGTPVSQVVAKMILMSNGTNSYTIDEDVLFYDDGGPEGKISNNFEGWVTFVPQTEGKKIQITFPSLSIFYTESAVGVDNQDIFKVLNGGAESTDVLFVAEKNLYTNSFTVKSTAENGSLTVYLRSKTPSSYYQGNGFEATVSEFTPTAMTIVEKNVTKNLELVPAAGQKARLLSFNIKTENTEPALKISKVKFNTNGTYGKISQVALLSHKGTLTNAGTLLKTVDITSDVTEIELDDVYTLIEGDNYFTLEATVAANAQTGDKVELQLAEVELEGDTKIADFVVPEGHNTIKNIVISTCGTQTVLLYGSWDYTHTVASAYSTKYKAEECDQIVIFKPVTEGYLAQIDFADIDIYTSSSSYGTNATFEIYDGEVATGTPLFKLTNANKSTMPMRFRSSAANGALTVKFNPNTAYSSYTKEGWHATVKEYLPQNMTFEGVEVRQTTTEVLQRGQKNAALIDFTISTSGELNALHFSKLALSLKNTEGNVENIYLMQNDVEIAKVQSPETNVEFSDFDVVLAEGNNDFAILIDVKETATVEGTVDAQIISVKVGENTQNVENGDPEGHRVIKNLFLLKDKGDNGKVYIDEASLMFYDEGGADGKFSKSFDGYVTFIPTVSNSAIEIITNSWEVSGYDYMYFYNGQEVGGTSINDYARKIGNTDTPTPIISEAADGSMTVRFITKSYSTAMNGWEMEVRCHALAPLSVKSVSVTDVSPETATVGSGNLPLLRVDVEVEGDYGELTLGDFLMTENAIGENFVVYTTGTENAFATSDIKPANDVITRRGTYYYWIAADIKTTASVDDQLTVKFNSIQYGESALTPEEDVTATVTVVNGVHGEFTIGASNEADFATFAAAIASLSAGVDGPVTFNIESGTYSERVAVPEIMGLSAVNTLTFKAKSDNAEDVVLLSNTYNDPGYGQPEYGIFTINGADYVILRHLTIKSETNAYPALVYIKEVSRNITIDNCVLQSAFVESGSSGTSLVKLQATNEANKNNDYFTLSNSLLEGGYIGVYNSGTSYVALPKQIGAKVIGNTFRNQRSKSVYVTGERQILIDGNKFTQSVSDFSDCNAMDITAYEGTIICNNTISFAPQKYGNAISLRKIEGTEAQPGYVYNNAITVFEKAGQTVASSGIRLNAKSTNLTVAYNTILVQGSEDIVIPIWINNDQQNTRIVNNIFQSDNIAAAMRFYKEETIPTCQIANNVYSTKGTNLIQIGVSDYISTYENWLEKSNDQNSIVESVEFVSNSLLMPKTQENLLMATPIAAITTDITGKTRAAQPTVGAYEYDENLAVMPAFAEGYPKAQVLGANAANILLKSATNGQARVLVQAAALEEPQIADITTNGTLVSFSANTEEVLNVNSLEEHTEYSAYIVVANLLGEYDTQFAKVDFETEFVHHEIELVEFDEQEANYGETVEFVVVLVAQYEEAKPYVYLWTNDRGEVLGNEETLEITATETMLVKLKVTDKWGSQAETAAPLFVRQAEGKVATFEEYSLESETYKSDDSGWIDMDYNYLYSGTYAFSNFIWREYNYVNGFTLSNETSTEYTILAHQYRSAAGGAYEGENYAICYAGGDVDVTPTHKAEADSVAGFFVTNTAWAVDAILNGDGLSSDEKPFVKGDYFKLTVIGKNDGIQTNSVDFYLADYRNEDENEHYYLDSWQWIDLSSLGKVNAVEFELTTTKSNEFGSTTPTYFCMDNFGARMPVDTLQQEAITLGNQQINLNELVPMFGNGEIRYSLLSKNENGIACSLEGNMLKLQSNTENATADILFSQTQRGNTRYFYLPLQANGTITAVNSQQSVSFNVWPRQTNGVLHIVAPEGENMVELYTIDGRCIAKSPVGNRATIDISGANAGIYVVKITNQNNSYVCKIVKQ